MTLTESSLSHPAARRRRHPGVSQWIGALAALAIGCAAGPAAAANALEQRMLEVFKAAQLGNDAKFSAYVLDPDTGLVYVDIEGDTPLRPASLLKVITSAAALDVLGPEHTFETKLLTWGEVDRSGTLNGDLVILGGGDPSLGPRFQTANPSDVTKVLDDWAGELRRLGIRRISGRVLGDDRRYENEPHGMGWERMEFGQWYSAEVSALTFNDNCIDVIWRAGGRPGSRPSYTLSPNTSYVTFANAARVGAASQRDSQLRYFRFPASNEIRARGTLPPNSEKYDFAAIHDPARYTAQLMAETLKRRGIGGPDVGFNRRAVAADDPEGEPTVLLSHRSAPISQLIEVVNSESQNLYAEILAREVALASGLPGSFAGAREGVQRWLRSNRLQRNGFTMVDGSGLSPVNRVPARMVAEVLRHMYHHGEDDVYLASMAVPGSRTMRSRFIGPDFAPLYGKLRGKTGFINGTHSMGGYLEHSRGNEYIFVLVVNDYERGRSSETRELLDKLALFIHRTEMLP